MQGQEQDKTDARAFSFKFVIKSLQRENKMMEQKPQILLLSLPLVVVGLLLFSCLNRPTPERPNWSVESLPEEIGKLVVQNLLERKSFMMYETQHAIAVHYAEACTGYGAARFSGLMKDSAMLSALCKRYSRVIDEAITNTANHVDANVYGILPLELYKQSGDQKFFRQGIELADGQWVGPSEAGLTNQARYWVDDIYMITALQVAAWRATLDTNYLNRAALMVKIYLEKLQQPNGLFHHGEGAPFYWGRGNGWAASGMAELLKVLPENHQYFTPISEGYVRMMNTLLNHQADDGMWRQLIDVETSWKETSCTAMFGFAMHTGLKRGILKGSRYQKSISNAWKALTGHVDADGNIAEVCVGTSKSADISYYLDRPRTTGDFHGQAPLLWLACSLLEE